MLRLFFLREKKRLILLGGIGVFLISISLNCRLQIKSTQ
jgi:hypothetical protein